MSAGSTLVLRGDKAERLARLIAGSEETITRLEAALIEGWDVAAELTLVRERVAGWQAAMKSTDR